MSNEQQARRDAMADAETLREMARQTLWRTSSRLASLKRAASKGSQALGWAEGPFRPEGRYVGFKAEEQARFLAIEAARAAFRAVPALRGE